MKIETERFDPEGVTVPWSRQEHQARFHFGANFVSGAVVVDCACGAGEGARTFADAGARCVHAFDIDLSAVAATQARCRGLNVTVAVGDAQALPLPDESADVVISFETFEHLRNPEALLSEAHRILRHGGIFVCSTPNRDVSSPGNSMHSRPWNYFHTIEYNQAEFFTATQSRFSFCKLFGQNPVSVRRAALMRSLGKISSTIVPVRLNQLLKLPQFIFAHPRRYSVQSWNFRYEYEYCIVVCEKL